MSSANYIALSILNDCMAYAVKKATEGIGDCGKLTHAEAKLSQEAKEYFEAQLKEYKVAVELIKEFHEDISNKLWAEIAKRHG